jgi:uncharacterized tellurite resistance protein B-like protein
MLFRWLFGDAQSSPPSASDELMALVRRSLPEADAQTAAIIGAVAGLLAVIAYADRVYTDEEKAQVQASLARMHGLSAGSVNAIGLLLEVRIAELAHESLQIYTRVLYEGMERPARLEVLDLLMDLAAADQVLSMDETNMLRRVARGLGLTDQEYLTSQDRHRARLSLLQPR